jgi:hypothetical protein
MEGNANPTGTMAAANRMLRMSNPPWIWIWIWILIAVIWRAAGRHDFTKREFAFFSPPIKHVGMVDLSIQPVRVDRLMGGWLIRDDEKKHLKIKRL